MNQSLNVLNHIEVPITKGQWDLINQLPTELLIVPLITTLPSNANVILDLKVDTNIVASFVTNHQTYEFNNVLNLYNQAYSLFLETTSATYLSFQRLTLLVNNILTTNKITEVPDNFPLSVFRLLDRLPLESSPLESK